ncbi:MAG: geranylgeranylglycerol-phosphate geranylgeranyltransferase [Ignavibacteriales bacterium]|nr:geranylgeranylglycerol-phosphate geranylgeranyltransferase [Ignavibacteriales bacterium]
MNSNLIFQKIVSVFKIVRPLNFLITFLSIMVAGVICSEDVMLFPNIILAALAGSLVGSAGNVVNDLFDIEIDRINRPDRVLPKGLISKQQAWILFYILNVLAILFTILINYFAIMIVICSIILVFLYSYRLKKIPLVGNITVSFMTGLAFIFGSVSVGNINGSFIPAVFAFLINLIREIIKDMEDIEGDKINNVQTFPIKYGFNTSKNLVIVFAIFLILFTLVPFILKLYRIEYFIMVMITVNTILVYFIKMLINSTSKKNLGRLSSILKLDMALGLIAIYLGK